MVERLIAEAEAQSRPVMIVPTASSTKSVEPARSRRRPPHARPPPPCSRNLSRPDRPAVAKAIANALGGAAGVSVVWLDRRHRPRRHRARLRRPAQGLASGGLAVVETGPAQEALGASATVVSGGRLEAQVLRATGGAARSGTLHALSGRGQRLGSAPFTLGAGETRAVASFDLPLELRNQVTRIEIEGERSAGAVHLLDARSQWHRVGLFASESREQAQPLLAPLYYIERALAPFTEIAKSDVVNLPAAIDVHPEAQRLGADAGRYRRAAARGARPARRLGQAGRRAGAFRRPETGEGRRRPPPRRPAPGRAHAWAAPCRGRRRSRWRRSATTACSPACRCRPRCW